MSLAVALLAAAPLQAGVGDFDASYGRSGFVDNPLAALADGRMLYFSDDALPPGVVSPYDYATAPINSTLFHLADIDGRQDPAYGGHGWQTPVVDFQFTYSSARTADEKLLLGGNLRNGPALLRMDNNGNLDPTFGSSGLVAPTDPLSLSAGSWIAALAVQPDGRVLALINDQIDIYHFPSVALLRRLKADGTLDPTFVPAGLITAPPGQSACTVCDGPIVVLPDGTIRVGGAGNPVYFGTTGVTLGAPASSSTLPAGISSWQLAVLLPAGGSLDTGTTVEAKTAAGQPAGAGTDVLLARQRADGTFDRSFGDPGSGYAAFDFGRLALGRTGLYQYVRKVSISADGRRAYMAVSLSSNADSVATPSADSGTAIARVLIGTDGRAVLDAAFGRNGIVLLPAMVNPWVEDMTEQPDGALLLTLSNGWARWVIRLLGSPSSSRGLIAVDTNGVQARESDGELVVRVTRTGGLGAASVAYKTRPGLTGNTATAGKDYVDVAGRLDWGDGDTTDKFIRIPLINDGVAESTEYFTVVLTTTDGLNLNYSYTDPVEIRAVILDAGGSVEPPSAAPAASSATPGAASTDGGGGPLDAPALGLLLLCLLLRSLRKAPGLPSG